MQPTILGELLEPVVSQRASNRHEVCIDRSDDFLLTGVVVVDLLGGVSPPVFWMLILRSGDHTTLWRRSVGLKPTVSCSRSLMRNHRRDEVVMRVQNTEPTRYARRLAQTKSPASSFEASRLIAITSPRG